MTHDPILDEAPARLSADAARAYFDARMQGLCHEGALEIAEGVMSATGFALFETAIGACGIAWGPGGITGVQLPEKDAARTRARLARRFAGTGLPGALHALRPVPESLPHQRFATGLEHGLDRRHFLARARAPARPLRPGMQRLRPGLPHAGHCAPVS